MRTIGFVGLGKLGLPVALATEAHGFRVIGVDPSPRVAETLRTRHLPYIEEGAQDLLVRSRIQLVDMATLVRESDLVFVAVQTPHDPEFEGVEPLTDRRADFDYSYLRQAVSALVDEATTNPRWYSIEEGPDGERTINRQAGVRSLTIAVISTCLPGTFERELEPILTAPRPHYDGRDPAVDVVYNPFFIAMGTTIRDFLHPEFVLVGMRDGDAFNAAPRQLGRFYERIHDRPLVEMSVTSAELTKVAYNAVIGQKIVLANAIMEIAHHTGANCDDVADALALATDRIVSPAYMRGGMGDGGGCHPRDNIALSWLARRHELSCDPFGALMVHREAQTRWVARMAVEEAHPRGWPIVILGKAYKPETNLTVGSPATLLYALCEDERRRAGFAGPGVTTYHWDPRVDTRDLKATRAVYVVATKHPEFATFPFPPGSVVIDPFRYVEDAADVHVIALGRPA